jgi:hypothetical protein
LALTGLKKLQPLSKAIEFKRRYTLNSPDAQSIIYRAFME